MINSVRENKWKRGEWGSLNNIEILPSKPPVLQEYDFGEGGNET